MSGNNRRSALFGRINEMRELISGFLGTFSEHLCAVQRCTDPRQAPGDFRLDRRGGGLFRRDASGPFAPVPIGSRGLDILGVLLARAGEIVYKDEIIAAVWPGTIVEDSNLTVQIWALRRVLDKGRSQGSCIQTISGRGYRFVAPVTRPNTGRPAATSEPVARGLTPQSHFSPGVASLMFWPRRLWSGLCSICGIIAGAAMPARLTCLLVVLPFLNLSARPDQQFVADRVTEELTTVLSRFTAMHVTSRTTAYTYQHRAIDAKQIGRELGVRLVLEGSVYRSANHLRINTQLIRCQNRRASLGRAVRSRCRRSVRDTRRDHYANRSRALSGVDLRRGLSSDRASRRD